MTKALKEALAEVERLPAADQELIGRQVIAVVNFPVKQIAHFFSECLVLGVYNENKDVVLLQPSLQVKNGSKIG